MADETTGTPPQKAGTGKVTITLLIILGAIVLLGGGYALGKYYPNLTGGEEVTVTPTVAASVARSAVRTVTATADETAGWKTYTNTKYGFSIKYPQDWTEKKNSTYPDDSVTLLPPFETNPNTPTNSIIMAGGAGGHGMEGFEKTESKQITAGGLTWTVSYWTGQDDTEQDSGRRAIIANSLKGETEYALEARLEKDREDLFNDTFEQILSTFQFTQ